MFLVKYVFTNPDRIPLGIPEKQHVYCGELHAWLARLYGQEELMRVGRWRDEKKDSGECILDKDGDNLSISSRILRKGFGSHRLVLVGLHWKSVEKIKYGKPQTKYHVVATYTRLKGDPQEGLDATKVELPADTRHALDTLTSTTFRHGKLWENRTNVHSIVHNVIVPDATPQHAFVVRNRQVTVIPICAALPGDQE